MNYLGNQILKLRKREGLSQEEFADMINVSRQMVSKWELGESIPRASKVEIICDKFNISADQLFGTEESIGKNESHPVASKRLKIALKGIAIICLIVFVMYLLYAMYKFCLLTYLESKFKQYDNWTNYYAEIISYEDAEVVSKVEIWYKDNKYKIIRENEEKIRKTKWIDCSDNKRVYLIDENNRKIEIEQEKSEIKYKNGEYIRQYFKWINDLNRNKLKRCLEINKIHMVKNKDNETVSIINNKNILTLSNDFYVPIYYNDATLGKIKYTYYNIKLNEVKDEDIEIKKDL